ncbi:transglycosylase SLT domain-containing protein [Halomonas sp. ZH2S]|uniref:Transglycosylase SLT domain-containing protein n=1 Tax=Vreelandella zhuhanensis TaxID=2684210 RepID=A0A7X3KRP1_9GAMM|nr:transglycosylase SLT domain-containing protein [Halomonas zhuhanensis]MWJ28561.1 transglycosylase SLT domain-containing protein [Halomonas zhuhanensis]
MTYRTLRQRLLVGAGGTLLLGLLAATATSQAATTERFNSALPLQLNFWETLELKQQDAWSMLRKTFQWQKQPLPPEAQARVQKWIDYYRSSPENIVAITERARPWIAWITQQVAERGLPGELALIPFVESSFDPVARSHRGAAGLWQFMPRTGDAMGLVRNGSYDGRLDVIRATSAALDYIEMQADQWYKGDLTLSLAAYNAGAGTVNRALRHAPGQDYWSLRLPSETMHYLPKLYAIAAIVNDPAHYQVSLPDIHTQPGFTQVRLSQPVSLAEASRLMKISPSSLTELNPGLLNGTLQPRLARILLVPEQADVSLLAGLTNNGTQQIAENGNTYLVQRGDSLSAIAARYKVNQQELVRLNGIERPETIQPGQLLTLSEG